MVKLTAKRRMQYGKRRLVAGDVFEARDKDARLLTLLGRAAVYIEPPKPKRKKAEEVAVYDAVEPAPAHELAPGEYLRRDMRAED